MEKLFACKQSADEVTHMTAHFSVLMSVYIKEKPEYVKECFESLLNQTVCANEWVIVEDGPLTNEMYELLDSYCKKYPDLIKRIKKEKNEGLGLALRTGIPACSNELIARMDTDDIARIDRFEKQLDLFKLNPELDICGSHIKEFCGTKENVISLRRVPLTQEKIEKYQRIRSAFNHMTVMYKKSAVLKAGNYEHAPLMEDDVLWVRMLLAGAQCRNIDDYLVFARTGTEMIARRGGWEYLKEYRKGKRIILSTGFINRWEYIRAMIPQWCVALAPKRVRLWAFTHLLRTKEN